MRGQPAPFLARRMLSVRLLLASVTLTVLITSTLIAALATFGTEGLPQAVRQQLAHAPELAITVRGPGTAGTVAAGTRAVRASMRAAFGAVPYQLVRAVWSDPLGLPGPRGSGTVPLAQAVTVGRIRTSAALVAGTWPGPPPPAGPVGAALPVTVAGRLRLTRGALLTVRDRITGQRATVRVTGLFAPRDPASPYWNFDLIGTSGVSVQKPFVTYGPLVVSPAAFGPRGLAVGGGTWVALPDGTRISGADISGLAARVTRAQAYLQNDASLGGVQVTTGLPSLLAGLGQQLVVARSLLTMGLLQLLLLAAAALSLAARLLASHREEESALMAARGAGRWQVAWPALAEAAGLGLVAAAAGALLGARLAGLVTSGALHTARLSVPGTPPGAWLAALAVLALSTAILLWPALRPAAPGEVRARRGRQAALAGIARAGGDLSLVALAVLAVWQLRTYSAVAHSPAGGLGIDPVPVLAPALALAGVTLLPLRLLPAAARALDGLIARTRRLGAALASWEISRRPVTQSGPVLLVILAVGTGSLALSQYQSWRRSALDQAAFAAGSDVRVDTLTQLPLATSGSIGHAPGVTAAMPVARTTTGNGAQLIGLDARQAAATVLLRRDLSGVPAGRLWRELRPGRASPGLALPGRPARLRITATVTGGGAGHLDPLMATIAVQDSGGAVYDLPAGTLPTDGHPHHLMAVLSSTRQASYPLRLLGISLSYTLPSFAGGALHRREASHPAVLAISSLATAGAAGPFGAAFARGSALAGWRTGASAPQLSELVTPGGRPVPPVDTGTPPRVAGWRPGAAGTGRLSFLPGAGPAPLVLFFSGVVGSEVAGVIALAAPAPVDTVPAIATQSYLRGSHVRVGAVVPVTVGSATIPVKVAATVRQFPTVTGGGALIVDQAAVQEVLASRWQDPLPATEWWLRTATGSVPPGLPRGAVIADRAHDAAARLGNPLSGVPQEAALAIAAAAALLAAVGFSVSVAASLRARRTQSAVLAALGVARSGLSGQLCLEQLMLSVPAAVTGLLTGAGLAHVLVPAITLTPTAGTPVPPVLVEFPLGWAVVLAAAVAAIPVAVAAITVVRGPDPAAELRAAQAA